MRTMPIISWRSLLALLCVSGVALLLGAMIASRPKTGLLFGLMLALMIGLACLVLVGAAAGDDEGRYLWVFWALVFVILCWSRHAVFKAGGMPALSPNKLAFALTWGAFIFYFVRRTGFRDRVWSNVRRCKLLLIGWLLYALGKAISNWLSDAIPFEYAFKWMFEDALGFHALPILALGLPLNRATLISLTKIFVVAVLIQAAYSAAEYQLKRPVFASLINTEIDSSGMLSNLTMAIVRDGAVRLQSSFEHPLVYGEFMTMAMPLLFMLVVSREEKMAWRLAAGLGVLLIVPLSYLTGSRSAMAFSVVILAAIIFLRLFKSATTKLTLSNLLVLLGSLLLVVLASPALYYFVSEVVSAKTAAAADSSNARIEMLSAGLPKIWESPLFGYGAGQSLILAGIVVTGGFMSIDNHYLSVALDHGLIALFGFVLTGVWALGRCCRQAWLAVDVSMAMPYFSLGLSCLAFLGTQSILSITSNVPLYFVLVALCAMPPEEGSSHAG